MDRRQFISSVGGSSIALTAATSTLAIADQKDDPRDDKIRYCLNTSTIRGQQLSVNEEIRVAAEAGYDGIEPWIGKIREYEKQGGSLETLKQTIQNAGLVVESAIGFANWIVNDKTKRAEALKQARRDMELVRAIGGRRIAAPPAGPQEDIELAAAADRYRSLLELGQEVGVTPQLELWGHSRAINSLGRLAFIAVEASHPESCLLPDVYHIYKGGSEFTGLNMIDCSRIHVFHMNDYPSQPTREKISDADRVYPGDGVAPMNSILNTIYQNGFRGALSLELFNRKLWKQDPNHVATTGLAKMKACVSNADLLND